MLEVITSKLTIANLEHVVRHVHDVYSGISLVETKCLQRILRTKQKTQHLQNVQNHSQASVKRLLIISQIVFLILELTKNFSHY